MSSLNSNNTSVIHRPPRNADMVTSIQFMLPVAYHASWLDTADRHGMIDCHPNTQLHLLNRYFRTYVTNPVARLALVDDVSIETWLDTFRRLVLPFVISEGVL